MNRTIATHIELRANRAGEDRAFISGTRIRVHDIYSQAEIFGKSAAEISESLGVSLAKVHAALSWIFDNREQVVAELRQDEAFADTLKAAGKSGILNAKLDRSNGS